MQRRVERSGRVNGIMKEHSFTHVKATFSHQEQQFHAPRSNRAADQIIFGVANIVAYRTDVPSFCSKKNHSFRSSYLSRSKECIAETDSSLEDIAPGQMVAILLSANDVTITVDSANQNIVALETE